MHKNDEKFSETENIHKKPFKCYIDFLGYKFSKDIKNYIVDYKDSHKNIKIVTNFHEILLNEKNIYKQAHLLYQKLKPYILEASEINISSFSFGGIKCAAFLEVILNENDIEIKNKLFSKIKNVSFVAPLPKANSNYLGFLNSFLVNFFRFFILNLGHRPSVFRILTRIKELNKQKQNPNIFFVYTYNDNTVNYSPKNSDLIINKFKESFKNTTFLHLENNEKYSHLKILEIFNSDYSQVVSPRTMKINRLFSNAYHEKGKPEWIYNGPIDISLL